ncbi:GNAT family N-acetyltransferase [Parapedobacter koreensis]|uniref:Acetyltransferase (GNAT) family protein n=1 Tax=Parapedobacter koreensis TaxID=332977 RepID=A0A1H7NM47_9SPHI|nr:GNAT family N-acetyltransferase [Parapedobacter koreensis]SEL24451.1 Acetyltransferase (GNAT) family protein [Parapedobacter koreensis]
MRSFKNFSSAVPPPLPPVNDGADRVKINEFYLNYIRFIWDKIKLQRETTDRYFNYYLLLITTPIVAFAAVVGRSEHSLSEQLIGYLCAMLFAIGVCFYSLYIRQRINNITLGDELNEFVQLIEAFDAAFTKRHQSLQINGALTSPFSADFWVNFIQSIINSFWLCNAFLYIETGIHFGEKWCHLIAGGMAGLSVLLHTTIRDSCLYRSERRLPLLSTLIVTGWYRPKWGLRMYRLWLYRRNKPKSPERIHPMIKRKFRPEEVSIRLITPGHAYLKNEIPQLAIAQGSAHNVKLPATAEAKKQAATNFKNALEKKDVEIHALTLPEGSGAIFLSTIRRNGKEGLQIEDIIVLEDLRGHGLGGYLLCQAATLAVNRGLSFVAWECERNNPAKKLYLEYNAKMREDIFPYRLNREMLVEIMKADLALANKSRVTFRISQRFSVFRAMSFHNSGGDIDPTESWQGAQVDDLDFTDPIAAKCQLVRKFCELEAKQQLNFVDVVIAPSNLLHQQLVTLLGCKPNTYSGEDIACLWELSETALNDAAEKNMYQR